MSNYNNPSRSNTFEFEINGFKSLSIQLEEIPLTGIAIGDAIMENAPYNLQVPDNRVDLDALSVTFEVSEGFNEWVDICEWIYLCTITNDAHIKYATNAVMVIQDNNYLPVMTVEYIGVQPMALGQIVYSTTNDNVVEMKSNFTFRYDTIKVTHMKSNRVIEFHNIMR